MAHTNPASTITLFRVNCDSTYRNVWGFTSKSDLNTYLNGQPSFTYQDSQGNPAYLYYIRRNATVDIPDLFDDIEQYTYCRYNNNEGLGDEYAFIVRKEFLNMNCTRIYLQYDVWTNFLVNEGGYSHIMGNIERQLTYSLNYQPDLIPYKSVLQSEEIITNHDYIMLYVTFDVDHRNVYKQENTSGPRWGLERMITEDRIGGVILIFANTSSSINTMRSMLMGMSADQYIYNIYVYSLSTAAYNKISDDVHNSYMGYFYTVYDGNEYHWACFMPRYSVNRFDTFTGYTWQETCYVSHYYVSNNPKIYTRPYTNLSLLSSDKEQEIEFSELPDKEVTTTYVKKELVFTFNMECSSNGVVVKTSLALNNGSYKWITTYGAIAKNTDSFWNSLNISLGSAFGLVSSALTNSAVGAVVSGAGILTGLASGYFSPDKPLYSSTVGNNKLICAGNGNICARLYYPIASECDRLENYWDKYGYPINIYLAVSGINHTYYDYLKMNDVQIATNDMCLEELNMLKQILTNGVAIYHQPSVHDLGELVDSTTNLGG